MYTDDVKHTPDTLHAALVVSTKPHARLVSVDAAAAVKVSCPAGGHPGVLHAAAADEGAGLLGLDLGMPSITVP